MQSAIGLRRQVAQQVLTVQLVGNFGKGRTERLDVIEFPVPAATFGRQLAEARIGFIRSATPRDAPRNRPPIGPACAIHHQSRRGCACRWHRP